MSADPIQEIRHSQEAMLAELRAAGATITNPRSFRCPFHDDGKASAGIYSAETGVFRFKCHGCGVSGDIFDMRARIQNRPLADVLREAGNGNGAKPPAMPHNRKLTTPPPDKPKGAGKTKGPVIATYDYKDADGKLSYQVLRHDPKDFSQRRPDGNGHWVWGLSADEYVQGKNGDWFKVNEKTPADAPRRTFPQTPRLLYRLPELLAALAANPNVWVFVVEGEKDADNLWALGLVATCNSGGAGKWKDLADDSALDGRRVAIIPDRDKPDEKTGRIQGMEHAQDVARRRHGRAAVVKIVELPPEINGQRIKDASDWLDAQDSVLPKDFAAMLADMAEKAPAWTPEPATSPAPAPNKVEPYRPFPVDVLPEPMRSFVAQAAEAVGCDAAFVALPLLAAAASAIGNTRRIVLKRGWVEPPIIWAAIVGDSGTLKSPALELALRPLRQRQHEAKKRYDKEMADYNSALLHHEIEMSDWKRAKGEGPAPKKPKEPVFWRSWCDDTTIEALAVLLDQNWRGILMARDELAAWLGAFDRYVQGKGGDVAKWLEMHGGRSIMVDRKTGDRKTIYVPHATVSVTGGIQPATLQRALGRAYFENGLAARLLLACPPPRVKQWTETEIDPATETAIAAMFDRLYSLEPIVTPDEELEPDIVRLSAGAKRLWVAFYNEHAQEQVDLTGDLSAAWSKLEGYAARLALVVHEVRWAAGDSTLASCDVMDETSIASGVALSRWFGQETRRVYAILEETDLDRQRRELVELVQRHGGSVTARDLMRSHRARAYPTSEIAEQALNSLVQAGAGRWQDAGTTAQGGRPTRRFILADAVDVDTTPKTLEQSGVSSTELSKANPPVAAPVSPASPRADKTPELPKEFKVSSTSTPSTPAIPQRAAALDPDKPGPTDLLTPEQYKRYMAFRVSRPVDMDPAEKHARAWKAALRDNK